MREAKWEVLRAELVRLILFSIIDLKDLICLCYMNKIFNFKFYRINAWLFSPVLLFPQIPKITPPPPPPSHAVPRGISILYEGTNYFLPGDLDYSFEAY